MTVPLTPTSGVSARLRQERSDQVDGRLAALHAAALEQVPSADGRTSLVGVGGFGRRELSPRSDVDVVLLTEPGLSGAVVEKLAQALWYPLWDDGWRLDHAVRDTAEMRTLAARDWRAALGMLDARHVVGAVELTHDLRSAVLGDWRRDARRRLPELRAACHERAQRAGDLAHAAVPDLKESRGGLRDGVVLRALVATWLVDVPHQIEEYRSALLDVRDAVHEVSGRRANRLHPELVPDVAQVLGTDPDSVGRRVRSLGRRTAHLYDRTWRQLNQTASGPSRPGRRPGRRATRRPGLEPLGGGIARLGDEVVLERPGSRGTRPAEDPYLSLSVAATAAERGLLIAPSTAARLATTAPGVLPAPWPDHARRAFVRLLAAGPGLVPVWEELDQAGIVVRWLPEWGGVRMRPSEAALHRFTVDRHSVETCVEASRRLREVSRPDLLVVGALLHDIGKATAGDTGDHSEVGAPIAVRMARRLGFDDVDADTVGFLVRRHLLLPATAVRRDLEDPDTLCTVAELVGDRERLTLLATLTECDARSAGPAAWTGWRAGLVRQLVAALASRFAGGSPPTRRQPGPQAGGGPAEVLPRWAAGVQAGSYRMRVEPLPHGTRVWFAAVDRLGLLADVSGALAVAGLTVQAARAYVHHDPHGGAPVAMSWWLVGGNAVSAEVDIARLRLRMDRVLDGSTDPAAVLDRAAAGVAAAPRVRVLAGVSGTATVLEVRAADRAGLVWRICRVLADEQLDIRSAHLDTLGPQTEDVVYVTDRSGRALADERAERLCRTLAEQLHGGVVSGRG